MAEISTKPYLLRAIYEWCTDSGYTPHIAVKVDAGTRVPMAYVRNGEIVLNIGFGATHGLSIDNDSISFAARFSGVSRDIFIPIECVLAIYANETGQGMAFEATPSAHSTPAADAGISEAPAKLDAEETTNTATPNLASVTSIQGESVKQGETPDDTPEPPKKGGRPTLTRIK